MSNDFEKNLETLTLLSEALTMQRTLEEGLDHITSMTCNLLETEQAVFLFRDEERKELIVKSVVGIDSPNVKFLFDIYHQQITEGDVIRNFTTYKNEIGHFHFGDNPGRREPGTGELNYKQIFKAIDAMGYKGIVSSEFSKSKDLSLEGLLKILADCATW